MRSIVLIFLFSLNLFAATGWWDDFLTINGTSFWIGSNPGSGTQFQGHSFGTLGTLSITAANMKYWSDTQDRTGGAFYYKIMSSDGLTEIKATTEYIWTHTYDGGNNYTGSWTGSINVMSGLSPNTTYQFHIWAKSWGSGQGDSWLSNGGNNYVATFTTDGTVPVELVSFTAKLLIGKPNLNWQTATEINNYGFDIERSIDKSNWSKIGFVQGAGNSNSPKNYSYTDNTAVSGKYFYRLKQVDTDGTFDYSPVVEVDMGILPGGYRLEQNYPNPFNPSTSIKFAFSKDTKAAIKVYNALGVEVREIFNGIAEAGRVYDIKFNAAGLSSGVYYYKLITPEKTDVRKMMLTK